MAQETNIRPIELNNDTTKIIMDLGDSFQKDRIQKAQLAADKKKMLYEAQRDYQNKMFQATSEIPSMVKGIDSKFQAEAMAELVKVSSDNMNKVDPLTMKQKMNEAIQHYTALGNKSTAVTSQIENYTKALSAQDRSNFAEARLKDEVTKMALYKEVDGKLILKKPEEINENEDYVTKVLNGPDGWKYWNGAAGMETLQKVIKDGEKVTEKAKVTDQKGLVRTLEGTTVKYNPLFQRQNPKTGKVELKTDETGNLDEGTYQQIITDPKVNASFSRMAKTFVDNYNSIKPEDRAAFLKQSGMDVSDVTSGTTLPASIDEKSPLYATTFNTLKKAFATDFVARNIGKSEEDVQSKTIIQNNVSGQPQGYIPPADPEFTAPVDRLRAVVNGDTRFTGNPIKTAGGSTAYNITNQFKSLPLFKIPGSDITFGPDEVQYIPNYKNTGEAKILVRKRAGGKFQEMSVQAFGDLLVPKTDGTGYDPKPKPGKVR